MIDFHSHILPGIDDGSSSVKESLEMLHLSFQRGVEKMVATPHFYAMKESPEQFLMRRSAAWKILDGALPEDTPTVYLGAEVHYYIGISHTENLQSICIENTNVLMLEMPFHRWSGQMMNDVISLAQERELTVLLAHVDRYLSLQTDDTWNLLSENGVLFQVNASFFLDGWASRRRAFRLLHEGKIAVLGSDCHNMKDRKSNLDAAYTVIQNRFGEKTVHDMDKTAGQLLAYHIAFDAENF